MASTSSTRTLNVSDDNKPNLSFFQIWNMSFGFLGIQYGFGLQQANMSSIFRYLQADENTIPALWLAGPVTGLIVQPIIGALSDRTWTPRWGRRKPYFLIGAIMTSIALVLMPNSSALWMAAGLLWVLDTGLNITMEPFRAFVGDKLNAQQRTLGFATQSFFVGFGQSLANFMPFLLPVFGLALVGTASTNAIPAYVHYSFYIGALAVLLAVLYTVATTPEYPPADLEAFIAERKKESVWKVFADVIESIKQMPRVMKQLWWVKFFTWFSLPLMWQYLTLAIARHAYNAPSPEANRIGFELAGKHGNLCYIVFNILCFCVSFFLPGIAKHITRRGTHALFLAVGALGFGFMVWRASDPNAYLIGMGLVGLAWGSILSMPYVLLANSVPAQKMGVYMGLFNGFIVIPQIIQMTVYGNFIHKPLGDDPIRALGLAALGLLLAAISCLLVREPRDRERALIETPA